MCAQGVSEKVYTLIEGESHFSDGAAIVIFEVFLGEVVGRQSQRQPNNHYFVF